MAFKPYLLPILGLPDTFTIDTYKPATDLSKKRERSAKYAFKGRKYRDLFNAIPFNAPKDAIEVAFECKTRYSVFRISERPFWNHLEGESKW